MIVRIPYIYLGSDVEIPLWALIIAAYVILPTILTNIFGQSRVISRDASSF